MYFIAGANNLYSYNPHSNTVDQITTNGTVAGGLEVHSCGCVIIYTDHDNKVRQLFWDGTWTALPNPVVSNSIATTETALDETNNRFFFVGTDRNVYYYKFNYNTVNQIGAVLLGNGSKEGINNGSLCALSANAGSNLKVSPDGNMVFYKATDNERWYYFNDKENSLVSKESWYKSPLMKGRKVLGPMVFEKISYGNMYNVDLLSSRIYMVQSAFADHPVEDCYVDSNSEAVIYKNQPLNVATHDTIAKLVELKLDNEEIQVSLYPNPSEGAFTFKVSGVTGQQIQLQITTVTGEIRYSANDWSQNGETFKLKWNPRDLASGYYIYHITTSSGEHVSGKLIKL